jgi:hypothetical protein
MWLSGRGQSATMRAPSRNERPNHVKDAKDSCSNQSCACQYQDQGARTAQGPAGRSNTSMGLDGAGHLYGRRRVGELSSASLGASIVGKLPEVSASRLKIAFRKVDPPHFDVYSLNWQAPAPLFGCNLTTQVSEQ